MIRRAGMFGARRALRPVWYVDSAIGSDSNTGRSPGDALRTLSALMPKLRAGDAVAFARGSHWRETLSMPVAGVNISPYGSGARPLIDCSDAVAPGDWAKTDGFTSVFQATVPFEYGGASSVRVWEDDVKLTKATSIADCDSKPGSYYPLSETTSPVTIHVHASDDGNPASNGKTYEYSRRQRALGASGGTIQGVAARRAASTDGNIGFNGGTIVDCYSEDCPMHCFYFGPGTRAVRCEAYDGQFGMFVCHTDAGATGAGCTLEDCYAHNPAYTGDGPSGFYSHTNGSHNWEYMNLVRFKTEHLGKGIEVNEVLDLNITDCEIIDAYQAVRGGRRSTTITGSCIEARMACVDASGVTTIRNSRLKSLGAGNAILYCVAANAVYEVTDNVIEINDFHMTCVAVNAPGVNLTFTGNTVNTVDENYVFMFFYPVGLLSDRNAIVGANPGALWFKVNGTDYRGFETYKAATGQDANSTP